MTVRINFAPGHGQTYEAATIEKAILWAQGQLQNMHQIRVPPNISNQRHTSAWSELIQQLSSAEQVAAGADIEFAPLPGLARTESPFYDMLVWILNSLSGDIAEGAWHGVGLSDHMVWSNPGNVAGFLLSRKRFEDLRDIADRTRTEAVSVRMERAENETLKALESINDFRSMRESYSSDLDTTAKSATAIKLKVEELERKVASDVPKIAGELAQARAELTKEMDAWLEAQKEMHHLQAPVELWNERAKRHVKAAATYLKWALGVGLAAPFAAMAAFLLALAAAPRIFWLAGVGGAGAQPGDPQGFALRYDVLLASSVAILTLTLLLWALRITVKLHNAHRHLDIDATSRGALINTYLSLTAQSAATDADRAIMLGVIFNPVQAGLVGDDGPPPISPAALLAAIAANPTRAAGGPSAG